MAYLLLLNGTENTTNYDASTMNLKNLMQSLSVTFKQIENSAESSILPGTAETGKLLRISRQIHDEAPEGWSLEAEDFAHLADQLNKAVRNDDLPSAIRLIDSLKDAQCFCHETFI